MKCAIFCWLLALFGFQIVHGVTQKDLDNACKTYISQWHSYLTQKQHDFNTAKSKSKKSNEAIDECVEDLNAQLKDKIPKVEDDFGGCTSIKTPHVSAQSAKDCCIKAYNTFKKWMGKLMKEKLSCL